MKRILFLIPFLFISSSAMPTGHDANTVLLLHCDGTDGSTTITDSSSSAKTMTAQGAWQIDTAQSKFGGASCLSDGDLDYVTTPDHADFDFPGDLTIDFWVRLATTSAYHGFFSSSVGLNDWLDAFNHYVDGRIEWTFEGENHRWTWAPSANTWIHLAFVRTGSSLKIFADGVALTLAIGDGDNATAVVNTGTIQIGTEGSNNTINGWIDEFRISNVARWTTNFTPPTAPYGVSSNVQRGMMNFMQGF